MTDQRNGQTQPRDTDTGEPIHSPVRPLSMKLAMLGFRQDSDHSDSEESTTSSSAFDPVQQATQENDEQNDTLEEDDSRRNSHKRPHDDGDDWDDSGYNLDAEDDFYDDLFRSSSSSSSSSTVHNTTSSVTHHASKGKSKSTKQTATDGKDQKEHKQKQKKPRPPPNDYESTSCSSSSSSLRFSAASLDNNNVQASEMQPADESAAAGMTEEQQMQALAPSMLPACCPWDDAWDDVKEDEPENGVCVECEYGQTATDKERNPFLEKCRTHYRSNYHEVDRVELARQYQRLFNKYVRKCIDGNPFYSMRMIDAHYHKHINDPYIRMEKNLRIMDAALDIISENGVFRKRPDDVVIIDPASMRQFTNTMAQWRTCYKEVQPMRSSKTKS